MDDRELAMIIRKRNLAYVKHLKKTQPHTESHDKLEGGFLSAVAAAAKIAVKMAIRAGKAAAKVAAKAAKQGAKAAAKAAKLAKRLASKASKSKKLERVDQAMTIADVGQAAASIAQNLMKKKIAGEEITDAEFNKLTAGQQIEIDFQRWARGLDKAEYDVFKSRGGDKSAAMQLARLMDAGMDPDDWVGNELNARLEATTEQLEDALDYDPNDDDECEDELDKDDRSSWEINGLIALSLIDQGIGEAISESQLERRQRARRDACVRRKDEANKKLIGKLKKEIGVDPDDPDFDIDNIGDDLNVQAFILGKMIAQNPNVEKAINLDGPRSMAGLPKIDISGKVFDSEDSKYNDDLEKMALWFINNNTLEYDDYPDQNWIATKIKYDQNFINRAIAKMKYYEFFASADPEIRYTKNMLKDDYLPLTPFKAWQESEWTRQNPDWIRDMGYLQTWSVHYNPRKDASGNMLKDEKSRFYSSNYGIESNPNRGNVPSETSSVWNMHSWPEHGYQGLVPNKAGAKAQQRLADLLVREAAKIKEATELVSTFDEKSEALTAKDPFVPNKAYVEGDLMRYDNKVYKCTENHTSGDKPDFTKWDELALYDEEDLDYLQNIGAATPYADYTEYPVGVFVKYQDRIFKKIKESAAGIVPTDTEYWDEILLNNADLLNLQTDPGRKWVNNKNYVVGDKVFYNKDLQSYVCIRDVGGYAPDAPNGSTFWKRLITFNIDTELATQLIKEQRLAVFSSVIQSAEDFDAAAVYQLRDIVYAYDGKYYELIKEKKDRDGDVVAPPIPPNATYWKVVSKGITVWDPKETYEVNDFVQYGDKIPDDNDDDEDEEEEENQGPLKQNYLCIQKAPAGTLPTDGSFWQPLDEQFKLLDEAAIAVNTQNFQNAVMERADEFQDDPTSSYSEGEIVKVVDEDGYPQFYMCIKDIPFGRAFGDDLRKAKPYDNGKVYAVDDYVVQDGLIYKMIDAIGKAGPEFAPPRPTNWEVVGYEKDPGPPNAEFWKDYSAYDAEEEKYDKLRKSAKSGDKNAKGIKVNDIVVDPLTGMYYKLISTYNNDNYVYEMRDLPYFDNTHRPNATYYIKEQISWEPQDIPTALEAKIANIEARTTWRNDKLYKRNELVMDQYKLKYLVVKDTPYAPMNPRSSPDYFVPIGNDDWDEAIAEIQQGFESTAQTAQDNASLTFDESDYSKKYKWGEIVFYKDKFYSFQANGQTKDNNSPETARERPPGSGNYAIEWVPCNATGKLQVVKDTDYPGVHLTNINICMYMRGGPIIQIGDKYYVFNGCYKEIFGLGGPDELFTNDWYGFWGTLSYKQGPEDTMTTEVFADGKPKFKHDATGAIIGENVDTSKLPPAQAKAVDATIDKNQNKITCPTAEDDGDDGDDGDDDDDTHHEEVTAEKAFEKAMTEWVAKGSIPEDDPRLLQGQNPPTPVGTASGYNIEELDGSQYHQKKKRVYKRKNKIGM